LEITSLLELTSAKAASILKSRTVEEIWDVFTPDDETLGPFKAQEDSNASHDFIPIDEAAVTAKMFHQFVLQPPQAQLVMTPPEPNPRVNDTSVAHSLSESTDSSYEPFDWTQLLSHYYNRQSPAMPLDQMAHKPPKETPAPTYEVDSSRDPRDWSNALRQAYNRLSPTMQRQMTPPSVSQTENLPFQEEKLPTPTDAMETFNLTANFDSTVGENATYGESRVSTDMHEEAPTQKLNELHDRTGMTAMPSDDNIILEGFLGSDEAPVATETHVLEMSNLTENANPHNTLEMFNCTDPDKEENPCIMQ
jgi:hypothetical protein